MVGKQLGRQAYHAAYAQTQKLMAAELVVVACSSHPKQKLPHGRACSSLSKNNEGETQAGNDHLPRCQMSRSYSAMVRSEENIPALAMFTRHLRRQPMGSQA